MVLKDKLYGNQFERNVVGKAIKSISNKWTFYILKDLFLGKNISRNFRKIVQTWTINPLQDALNPWKRMI